MTAALDRISALLAKAERTDNEAEADAYLMKAQQLATLASVDLAVARARTARREARQQPESRTTTIGEKGRRANPHLIALFVAIAHANDAKVDVAANSTYVIGYGMPADLDVVETIYASLAVHMVHSSQAYVAGRSWSGETYLAAAPRGRRSQRKPHTAQTARAAFYRAYVERIGERLEQARRDALVQVAQELGTEAYLIDREDQVREEWLQGKHVVGISSGASAPEELVERLVGFFRDRGVEQVEEFEVLREDVRFMLPKRIRQDTAAAASA